MGVADYLSWKGTVKMQGSRKKCDTEANINFDCSMQTYHVIPHPGKFNKFFLTATMNDWKIHLTIRENIMTCPRVANFDIEN